MRVIMKSISGFVAAGAVAVAAAGCGSNRDYTTAGTAGEQIEARAVALKQKAELVQKGEKMIAEGQAQVAKGRALSDQGKTLDGEREIIAGEAKIREGNLYLSRADEMQLPAAPTTLPSDVRPYVSSDRGYRDGRRVGTDPTVGTDVNEVDRNRPIDNNRP